MVHNGQIKIADFGLSKIRDEISSNSSRVLGHTAYVDPQCFQDEEYTRNEKSDIYALGVLFWELTSGKPPFENVKSYLIPMRIKNGNRENAIDGTPSEYIKLYTQCWDEDPEKRPTMEFILASLNKVAWETRS